MKVSLNDLVNLGLMDEKCAQSIGRFVLPSSKMDQYENLGIISDEKIVAISEEMLQDTFAVSQGLKIVKTPEPTQEEIDMWKKVAGLVWSAGEFKGFPTSCDFVRTPEPTEQEVAEWQEEYAKFKDLDFKTLGKNVKILDKEKPYYYWMPEKCPYCGEKLNCLWQCHSCGKSIYFMEDFPEDYPLPWR